MVSDLSVLQRSLPLQLRLQMPHHYLDLRNLWLELKKQRFGIELPFGNINRAGDALTDLSLVCLGKKLNKSNQCSNWANRPLRREQILYAGKSGIGSPKSKKTNVLSFQPSMRAVCC